MHLHCDANYTTSERRHSQSSEFDVVNIENVTCKRIVCNLFWKCCRHSRKYSLENSIAARLGMRCARRTRFWGAADSVFSCLVTWGSVTPSDLWWLPSDGCCRLACDMVGRTETTVASWHARCFLLLLVRAVALITRNMAHRHN